MIHFHYMEKILLNQYNADAGKYPHCPGGSVQMKRKSSIILRKMELQRVYFRGSGIDVLDFLFYSPQQ